MTISHTDRAPMELQACAKLDEIVENSLKGAAIWNEVKDNLKKSALSLSGGQQQRVLLARALCATDSVLILDEPVTGLDPAASMEFYETIKDLNKKENVTIIMVSHDIKNCFKLCNTYFAFRTGK